MKDQPTLKLLGHDGNIFAVLGSASRLLKRNGLAEESKEMFRRMQDSHDYYMALGIISEYVQTEISGGNRGFLEAEDIIIDPELIPDENGVDAYIGMNFDICRRFNIALEGDDYAELYATYKPELDTLTACLAVKRCDQNRDQYLDVWLYPSERNIIISKMNEICIAETGKDLKEYYADWKREGGKDQKKSKCKEKHRYDR